MWAKQLKMNLKEGLHGANAATFVRISTMFRSNMFIEKDGKKVNAKSTIGILVLDVHYQDTVLVFIDGDDENEAAVVIEEFFTTPQFGLKRAAKKEL